MRRELRGFTLIELVITLTLTGLVAVMLSVMGSRHMEGYLALERRAALAMDASWVTARLRRDLDGVDPVSVRARGATLVFSGSNGQAREYRCDGVSRRLMRNDVPLADDVTACRFYLHDIGNGVLVTASAALSREGDTIHLLEQFHVPSR